MMKKIINLNFIDKLLLKLADIVHLPVQTIKYTISSMVSSLMEMLIYYLIVTLINEKMELILIATIISRTVGTTINFIINKYWCFKVFDKTLIQLIEFVILFVVKLYLSFQFVYLLSLIIPIPTIFIKIVVDSVLFILGYVVQNYLIFKK